MRTFIGTGLLGSGFVRAWLKRGEEVKVWNRTPQKAEKLEIYGAKAVPAIEEAVQGVKKIHLVLKDDAAVDEVLANAESHLEAEAVIIDHTTTSVEGAIKRTQEWKKKGFVYQHAPVLMGPQNALESTGTILISGDQQVIKELTADLASMTGTLMNYGDEVGKAAGLKLISNLLLLAVNLGLSDALTVARSLNISNEDLAKLPGIEYNGIVRGGFSKMIADKFDQPTWELVMARKDAQLMMNEAEKKGNSLLAISTLAQEMDRWIDKGAAHKDWTVFASDKI